MPTYYLYVTKIDQQRLFATNYNTPTPRVVTNAVHTWTVELVGPNSRLPSPLPTLQVQPVINDVPVGPPLTFSTWPATFLIDMSQVSDGTHIVGVRLLGADPLIYSPFFAQVIVNRSVDRTPVLPSMFVQGGQLEGCEGDWVSLSALGAQRAYPLVPQPAQPYTTRLTSANLSHEHIQPRAGYLWEPIYTVVRDQFDNRFVVGWVNEKTEDFQAAGPLLDRYLSCDGLRGIGYASSYITGAVGRNEDDLYFVESAFKRARFGKISPDGTITTIAGWRLRAGIVPYNPHDTTIPEALRATTYEKVGTSDIDMSLPLDCVQDPRNEALWYACDTGNHRIVVINEETGNIRTYAGMPGVSGFRDGPAPSAQFQKPTSLTIAPDGTLYVADWANHKIRAISADGQQVSTLLGAPQVNPPRDNQLASISVAVARQNWMLDGPVAQAKVLFPFCIRMDSHGNLLLLEPWFASFRKYDFTTQTLTLVYTNTAAPRSRWQWFDVNRDGACGPVDDVLFCTSVGGGTNTYVTRLFYDWTGELRYTGTTAAHYADRMNKVGMTHYPWFVGCGSGAIWLTGFGEHGVSRIRAVLPTDPPPETATSLQLLARGQKVYCQGGSQYPVGVSPYPGFSLLHGRYGAVPLVPPAFPDVAKLSDVDLEQLIRSSWGGTVPRPTMSASDMQALIYFIRRYAARG